jgi:hypothetical protein
VPLTTVEPVAAAVGGASAAASAAAGSLRGCPLGASTRAIVLEGRLLLVTEPGVSGVRQPDPAKSLLWLITTSGCALAPLAAPTVSVCRVARRLAMLFSSAPADCCC